MKYEYVIIGGGIIGLATAYHLLRKKPGAKCVVLEKEEKVAKHQTGNNSGVIHSGIYYKPGSLKAINCRKGYQMLLDFSRENNIPHEVCSKIIVATHKEELPMLNELFERGLENGLNGIVKINKDALKDYEPYVNGVAGIYVPHTGIIDYVALAEKFKEEVEKAGGKIQLKAEVNNLVIHENEVVIETSLGEYHAQKMINCAGLYSDKIAKMTHPKLEVRIIPFRGEYYKIKEERKHLVRNLIYPVPDPSFPFLGVHFTRMINGELEAGPNAVLALGKESYRKNQVNWKELKEILAWPGFRKVAAKYWKTGIAEMYRSWSKSAFTNALQELIPDIKEDDLMEGGAGIRAQACHINGKLIDDFLILEGKNVINVVNAPSPAATSSLAIGDTVSEQAIK